MFKDAVYLGDPLNTIKIFNDKEVDEIIVVDIAVSRYNRPPNYDIIESIASECFMPVCYGGGIKTVEQVSRIISLGIEKVSLNTAAFKNPEIIHDIAQRIGRQSTVVSVDAKKDIWGRYHAYTSGGSRKMAGDLISKIREFEQRGAGEILINSIDRDGTFSGYDLDLVNKVSRAVEIPVVACGGASGIEDFQSAIIKGKASAVAAGSMFVFNGKHRAVLMSYPSQEKLSHQLFSIL